MKTNDPMHPVDLPRFWHDDALARQDPFAPNAPQPPLGLFMSYETIFDELGHPFDMARLDRDYEFARSAAKAYNDRAETIVGRRLLNETAYDPSIRFPPIKSLGEVFGCTTTTDSWTTWLHPAAHTPSELSAVLDRVERLDLPTVIFPDTWQSACKTIFETHGLRPALGHWLRGPVTLAMSIYGVEETIFLLQDEPQLAARFRDVILSTAIRYYEACDQASDPASVRPGFGFADDNCAMLTPDLYEFFGLPILQGIFQRFAPAPNDWRYQHSDSAMAHLLPLLARTNLGGANFGPTVRFAQIRAAMPRTIVDGTLAPFTMMRNDHPAIIAEVTRDCREAHATHGLSVTTAGSINNGTRLTALRTVLHTIQTHGRYQ